MSDRKSFDTDERLYIVNFRDAFPPNDPVALRLLVLLGAANDLIVAYRRIMGATDPVSEHQDYPLESAERTRFDMLEAEAAYAFRMACGHCDEALDAFAKLIKLSEAKPVLDRLEPEYRQHFELLKSYVEGGKGSTEAHQVIRRRLKEVRNKLAFHYAVKGHDLDEVAATADALPPDTQARLVVASHPLKVRYLVADSIVNAMMDATVGKMGSPEMLKAVSELSQIHNSLISFANSFALEYLVLRDVNVTTVKASGVERRVRGV